MSTEAEKTLQMEQEARDNLATMQAQAREQHYQQVNSGDDGMGDEESMEGAEYFCPPGMEHTIHLMSLIDLLSTPKQDVRPTPGGNRP